MRSRLFFLSFVICLCLVTVGCTAVPDTNAETTAIYTEVPPVTLTDTAHPTEAPITTQTPIHAITFFVEDEIYYEASVKGGDTLARPTAPDFENRIFLGWYTDESFEEPYSFSLPVENSFSLYARFTVDAGKVINTITTETIRAMVKIETVSYNTVFGFTTESSLSQGSGVIFAESSGRYYVLTNCHVAKKQSGYDKVRYQIYDYQGNAYSAALYDGTGTTAIDSAYDLACLVFTADKDAFPAVRLAEEDLAMGSCVISLGYPQGQLNAITFGKTEKLVTITLSDTEKSESNVTFPVIRHTAQIASGSSGGPLLSDALTLVGVNFAGEKGDGFHNGYAIPLSKIKEFLEKYVYS